MKHFITISSVLLACLLLTGVAFANSNQLKPFFFDGCSMVPEGTPNNPDLWCECCLVHDIDYWMGGSYADRNDADWELGECVSDNTGNPILGFMFYLGVRAGGSPYYNLPWRWGFGWPYGRGYKSMTTTERQKANQLLQKYFNENPNECGN